MDRIAVCRNLLLALVLTGCGSHNAAKPHPTPAPPAAVAKRCGLHAAGGNGGFPAGLLPTDAVVTADGTAIADGRLPVVFAALKANAVKAGLQVGDSELETLDAEIELSGSGDDLGLRLGLAPKCARATQVRLAG